MRHAGGEPTRDEIEVEWTGKKWWWSATYFDGSDMAKAKASRMREVLDKIEAAGLPPDARIWVRL